MPYCAQCGAGVEPTARRCSYCKKDPFPEVMVTAYCPACERTYDDPDLRRCEECDSELEIREEAV
jgi:hypothetical protein